VQTPEKRSIVHSPPDSFAAVIKAYMASPKFAKLAPGTQANYRHLLELAGRPDILGGVKAAAMHPALVQGFLDELADRPGAQMNAKTALTACATWATVRRLLPPYPITKGTEVVGGGDGHRPWTDQQIDTAVRHARPNISRAILLAANTGQRGSDLVRMRWIDLEIHHGRLGVNVIQRKTKLEIWVPFTQQLSVAMESWERLPGPILRTGGKPWHARNSLSKAWARERDTNAELATLRGLHLHGLRASACVRLRRLGATEAEISSMVGLSIPMVSRYCRFSVQKDNAMAAVYRLDGTPWQPADHLAGSGVKKS
jgi:integrase